MKRLLAAICLFLFFIANSAFAGNKEMIVFAVEQGKPVSVSLIEKADYVSFAVTIISRQKEPQVEFAEISEARELLIKETKKNEKIKIHNGPIYLSSTSNSKTSFSYGSSQITVHLLIALADKDGDVFKAAAEITKLVKGIEPPGQASYRLSPMKLAINNPDKYRSKLLCMIYEDINNINGLIKKAAKFSITGVESPVLVRQFNFTQVEIFLDYTLSIEIEGEQISPQKTDPSI